MLIFMEFCAEGTLECLVAESSGLPEILIRRYTQQLLQAVATLHHHGVVHRDIKSKLIGWLLQVQKRKIIHPPMIYHYFHVLWGLSSTNCQEELRSSTSFYCVINVKITLYIMNIYKTLWWCRNFSSYGGWSMT